MTGIVTRLQEELDGPVPWSIERQDVRDAIAEIERLRREVDQLRGVVRAHEGMYSDAAEQIDLLRGWLERVYRLAVGHGPNWNIFSDWEEAIQAHEEARRG